MLSNASTCFRRSGLPSPIMQPLIGAAAGPSGCFLPEDGVDRQHTSATPAEAAPAAATRPIPTPWSSARDPLSIRRVVGSQPCDDRDRPCLPAPPARGCLECRPSFPICQGSPVPLTLLSSDDGESHARETQPGGLCARIFDKGASWAAWREILRRRLGLDNADMRTCTYVSLNNEVTIKDLAEAFDRALATQGGLDPDAPFDAMVHSTGMLIVRSWLAADPLDRKSVV